MGLRAGLEDVGRNIVTTGTRTPTHCRPVHSQFLSTALSPLQLFSWFDNNLLIAIEGLRKSLLYL